MPTAAPAPSVPSLPRWQARGRSNGAARSALPTLAGAGLAALLALLAGPAEAAGAPARPFGASGPPTGTGVVRWRPALADAPGDAPTALAVDPWGRLAVGGIRGVRGVSPDGVAEVWLRRGPVHDLLFLDGAALLVATGEGLFRLDRRGRALPESLAPGSERVVRRLAAAGGLAVAATDGGVFLREPPGRWRPVRALPDAPASVVALREPADASDLPELWSVIEGQLWIGRLAPGTAPGLDAVQRVSLPDAELSEPARDVAFDLPQAEALLVFPTSFSARDGTGRWRTLRPALPPGARATRLAFAHARLWLATDAGLLSAPRLEGPWRRAEAPLGSTPVVALAGASGALWVATERGVLASREAGPDDPRVRRSLAVFDAPGEPAVGEVHAAVLRYVDLRPERLRALQRGAGRRGLLPQLDLRAGYVDDRSHRRDHDQSFVSGDTRNLYDEQSGDDHGLDFAVTLSWDFGDALYHPEQVDLLRESRAVIALRDDVLDEVTQIYFERRRVLAEAALLEPGSPERASLTLHAAELAAGLDAWTGGWFSRRLPPARLQAPGPATPPNEE